MKDKPKSLRVFSSILWIAFFASLLAWTAALFFAIPAEEILSTKKDLNEDGVLSAAENAWSWVHLVSAELFTSTVMGGYILSMISFLFFPKGNAPIGMKSAEGYLWLIGGSFGAIIFTVSDFFDPFTYGFLLLLASLVELSAGLVVLIKVKRGEKQ